VESILSKLVAARDHVLIADLGLALDQPLNQLPLIGEAPQSINHLRSSYKVASNLFVMVRDGTLDSFAWAPSDGAFAYALTYDAYFDDGASGTPPAQILPNGCGFSCPEVAHFGKQSGERWFSDYDFNSTRHVDFGRFYFTYRHSTPNPTEAPICIRVVPKVEVRHCA
jgi:hypothetical protein